MLGERHATRGALAALAVALGCGDDPAAPPPDAGPPAAVCGDGEVTGLEACDDGVNDRLGGGCQPGCAALDRSDEVFARDLIVVEIALPAEAWDALRHEYKSRHTAFGRADCRDAPVPNPYTWYGATVTIDGEVVPMTGVRKKGHIGSQSTLKPSLKLKFDEVVAGQTYRDLERLALNNSKSDPAYARTCLTYRVFAAAGVPAPRCTYATVSVNGEPLGVYVAIDEVDDRFLARHFADPGGNLYEGTATDFRPEFIGGFEQEENRTTDPSRADLAAVLAALDAGDVELEAALAPLVSLDALYRFWALESLVWHRDGYSGNANNFFLYADPSDGGRFRFLPWGPDSTFQRDNRATVPDSVLAFSALTRRLYQTAPGRARFYAELDALLAEVWDAPALAAEAARVAALVEPHVAAADQPGLAAAATELAAVIDERAGAIAAARAGGEPAWTDPLRSLPCRIPVGPIAATFATTWDTLAVDPFTAGDATVDVSLDGAPVVVSAGGARAGLTAAGAERVQLIATIAGSRRLVLTADLPDHRFFEPYTTVGDHLLAAPPVSLPVSEQDISGAPVELRRFEVGEGRFTFTQIGTTAGAPVVGSFDGTLYLVP